MPIRRVPVTWSTGAGGSGLSVFYTAFGTDATVEIAAFWNAIKANFPVAVAWDVPASGDVVDEVSGLLTGAWTGGTAATLAGTAASAYAAGTGAYVRWQTAGIVGGHRVRGRTFLAPLVTGCYESNGTIAGTNLATMQTAANTLAASGKLQIWHRPKTKTSNDGSSHAVVAGTIPDKVTSLRTRRS